MCKSHVVTGSCTGCFPYKDGFAISAAVIAGLLFISNSFAIILIVRFPLFAFLAGVLGFVAWFIFMGSCCCVMNKCGFITAGVLGIVAGFATILLRGRIVASSFTFDFVCSGGDIFADDEDDYDPYNNNNGYYQYNNYRDLVNFPTYDSDNEEYHYGGRFLASCSKRRNTFGRVFIFSAIAWFIASILVFIFVCCRMDKYEKRVLEEKRQREEALQNPNKQVPLQLEQGMVIPTVVAEQASSPVVDMEMGRGMVLKATAPQAPTLPVIAAQAQAQPVMTSAMVLPVMSPTTDPTERSESTASASPSNRGGDDPAMILPVLKVMAAAPVDSEPKKKSKKKKESATNNDNGNGNSNSASSKRVTKEEIMGSLSQAKKESTNGGHDKTSTEDNLETAEPTTTEYDENGEAIKKKKKKKKKKVEYDENGNVIKRKKKKKNKKPKRDDDDDDDGINLAADKFDAGASESEYSLYSESEGTDSERGYSGSSSSSRNGKNRYVEYDLSASAGSDHQSRDRQVRSSGMRDPYAGEKTKE